MEAPNCLVHCTVSDGEWSVGLARALDRAWVTLQEELIGEGYTTAWTVSPNPKFCEYMLGEKVGEITYNNTYHGVFKWELK